VLLAQLVLATGTTLVVTIAALAIALVSMV
jgi:hypothetical protein